MRRSFLVLLCVVITLAVVFALRSGTDQSIDLSADLIATPEQLLGFSRANGPGQLVFPRDFGPHPDYQTEWWYYTGNLETADGHHFGFELTFFRRALLPPELSPPRMSDWAANQIYMAHFALTDVGGDAFYAFERFERGAAGLAGAQAEPYRVWLDDWQIEQTGLDRYELIASAENIGIHLQLTDLKGAILHGNRGYSRKGPEAGNASYYYSETRLQTEGTITIENESFEVTGLTWKDHEFSTAVLSEGQVGWDWFSVQLDDGYELMLYQIRRGDGSVDPYSSGTMIAPDGNTTALSLGDFAITPTDMWRSPHSDGEYPMGWNIDIPSADVHLELTPYLRDQELNLSVIYWEGAVQISGSHEGHPVNGAGYVEMTGYAEPFNGQF